MRSHLSFLLVAALVAAGCQIPTEPTPPPTPPVLNLSCIGQNTCNSGPQGGTSASPDPAAAGGCTIATVGNSLHGTSATGGEKFANLRPNEQRTLDTTPKQANGQVLGANCPIAAVSWSNSNPAACRLNSSSVYTPTVTALAPGGTTCELRATVGSVTASEPIVISVLASAALWSPPTLAELLGAPPLDAGRWVHDEGEE